MVCLFQVKIVSMNENAVLRSALDKNLKSAVTTACLMLPESFSEEDLFIEIAGLSYSGLYSVCPDLPQGDFWRVYGTGSIPRQLLIYLGCGPSTCISSQFVDDWCPCRGPSLRTSVSGVHHTAPPHPLFGAMSHYHVPLRPHIPVCFPSVGECLHAGRALCLVRGLYAGSVGTEPAASHAIPDFTLLFTVPGTVWQVLESSSSWT